MHRTGQWFPNADTTLLPDHAIGMQVASAHACPSAACRPLHTNSVHRRPIVELDDGYFAGRYINATLALELETTLLTQLTTAVHAAHREHLARMYTSAASAAAVSGSGSDPSVTSPAHGVVPPPQPGTSTSLHWHSGLPAGIEYGGLLAGLAPRTPMMEGALMPCIGSAAAQLPSVLRRVVSALADVHQVRHHVELSELKRAVLQSAVVELGVLLQEEAHRALATPERTPKDSKFRWDGWMDGWGVCVCVQVS